MMSSHSFKLTILTLLVGICLYVGAGTSADNHQATNETRPVPPVPTDLFGPSNARTEDGKLIPVEHFFPASRCLSCHQDTHTA